MFKFLNYIGISNVDVYNALIERGLKTAEEITRDGNKLVSPTRDEAIALLKADDEKKKLEAENSGENLNQGDTNPGAAAQAPVVTEFPSGNDNWTQETQRYPGRYYIKLKKHIESKRNDKGVLEHIYEDLPMYYVNGIWCEDPEGKTESAYHDNLGDKMVEHLKETGEIL